MYTYVQTELEICICSSAESMLNQALLITESTFGAESEECLKVRMYTATNFSCNYCRASLYTNFYTNSSLS